ncbi:hypothetical protein NDU88_003778 [Pleurodeles waltl]|uniref:Uncharacterized protein n=1 Tax=Pleurodeles waltl TaxID=8319 RepID=A0AAV7KVW5_PLEWA|nr:hypothetical protein NDU88_003778 [Pleurodeles waltl]
MRSRAHSERPRRTPADGLVNSRGPGIGLLSTGRGADGAAVRQKGEMCSGHVRHKCERSLQRRVPLCLTDKECSGGRNWTFHQRDPLSLCLDT